MLDTLSARNEDRNVGVKSFLAGALALVMAVGIAPVLAQQASGTMSGKVTDGAKQPYSDYAVQLRDAATGQIVNAKPLNPAGRFSFAGVTLSRPYLVELVQTKEKRVVCTEGPYSLTSSLTSKTDVNINCGRVPAALWVLAASAGAAAAIAVATRSVSR